MTPEPALWVREDHTKAKHELLLAFFNKWVSIHSGYFASRHGGLVRVYDGFAGPGVYAGGEPGSPRIMLEALLSNANLRERWSSVRYEFTFVEHDPSRAMRLRTILMQVEQAGRSNDWWTDRISWSVICGRYEENLPKAAPAPSALFLFLDPFGYSQAPMTLTTELVQQPKSDTMIFLPLSFVNRFAGREGQDTALDRFFGTPRWRDVPDGQTRPAALLALFREQLVAAGLCWTGAFRLKPPVGASAHLSGYESFKEGFWAVDPRHGTGFTTSRPAPEGQQTLGFVDPEQGPDTSPLLAAMREHFGRDPFTVEEAIESTRTTPFLKGHVKNLTLAPAEGKVLCVTRPPGVGKFKENRGMMLRFV